jgi:hypothetical protein
VRARRDGLVRYRRRSGRHRLSDRGRDRVHLGKVADDDLNSRTWRTSARQRGLEKT